MSWNLPVHTPREREELVELSDGDLAEALAAADEKVVDCEKDRKYVLGTYNDVIKGLKDEKTTIHEIRASRRKKLEAAETEDRAPLRVVAPPPAVPQAASR